MLKKRLGWQNTRWNKCSCSYRTISLRLIFHRPSRKEAWQPQALIFHLQTHSFPHFAGAAIPFQTLCVFFHRKAIQHILRGKCRADTQTWGKSPMQHSTDAGICPSPHSRTHQTYHAQHHGDPAPLVAPALISQDYAPSATALTPYDITEYRTHSNILKASSKKEKTTEKQTKAHLNSFTEGTAVSHVKAEIL